MIKALIAKSHNPIKIPDTGTKQERLAYIEQLSGQFSEESDEFLDTFESKSCVN